MDIKRNIQTWYCSGNCHDCDGIVIAFDVCLKAYERIVWEIEDFECLNERTFCMFYGIFEDCWSLLSFFENISSIFVKKVSTLASWTFEQNH